MIQSIRGYMLPESYIELLRLADAGDPVRLSCFKCKTPFSPDNTHSKAGWRETQISSFCEACYDKLFSEDGDCEKEDPDSDSDWGL